METGPSARDRHVDILGAYVETTEPSSLPENVNLDVATEPYTASYGIAACTTTIAIAEELKREVKAIPCLTLVLCRLHRETVHLAHTTFLGVPIVAPRGTGLRCAASRPRNRIPTVWYRVFVRLSGLWVAVHDGSAGSLR